MIRAFALAFATSLALPALAQEAPRLTLPVACTLGQSCDVQNYVDHGTGERADFTCGGLSYVGHDGTDFRIRGPLGSVDVVAALPGRVSAVRDGEPDGAFIAGGPGAVAGKECGNGVMVSHAGGWSTQYCHMARGSVVVKKDQAVSAGQKLGAVGLSGKSEFRHLHLTVRNKGKVVDPFDAANDGKSCGGAAKSLWAMPVPYASGVVITQGFAGDDVTQKALELGDRIRATAVAAPKLIAYVRVLGIKAGDVPLLTVTGPDGKEFARGEAAPMSKPMAQYMIHAGRKARDGRNRWPQGRYEAHFTLSNGGTVRAQSQFAVTVE